MNKKLNGAAAPKHYESPALAVLNVNLEMGFAQSGNRVKDILTGLNGKMNKHINNL